MMLVFCSKNTSHDEEVRKLYEEMEQQIKLEKERVLAEVSFNGRLSQKNLAVLVTVVAAL